MLQIFDPLPGLLKITRVLSASFAPKHAADKNALAPPASLARVSLLIRLCLVL